MLEWAAFPFCRGSPPSRDQTQVSHIAGGFFTSWAIREARWVVVRNGKKPSSGTKAQPFYGFNKDLPQLVPPLFLLWLADVSWSSLHLTLMTIPELRHLLSIFCALNSRILWSPGQLQKMETLIFLAEWKQLPSSCSEHWVPGCLWEEVCSQVSGAWDSGEKGHVSVLVEWS